MTSDTADKNDPRPTIRGDQLLLAFQFLEKCSTKVTPHFFEVHLKSRHYEPFDHHFGFMHWLGEITIRAHVRKVITGTTNEVARHNMHFVIEDVVASAIASASPQELGEHGLTLKDKAHIGGVLIGFFNAVACEEITEKQLRWFDSTGTT